MSIQTAFTRRSIHAGIRRKKKNEEKSKKFFSGRGKPGGHQKEKDGIGIC
jgi:hypothetical protein